MIRKWNDRYEIYLTQDSNGGGREEKHVDSYRNESGRYEVRGLYR